MMAKNIEHAVHEVSLNPEFTREYPGIAEIAPKLASSPKSQWCGGIFEPKKRRSGSQKLAPFPAGKSRP